LAWRDLPSIKEARERAHREENTASDHDVLKLTGLDKMTNLPLGETDARGKLLWCFKPLLGDKAHYRSSSKRAAALLFSAIASFVVSVSN
jgi:hypothetical protein